MRRSLTVGLVVASVSLGIGTWWIANVVGQSATRPNAGEDGVTSVAAEITGGHETDPRDRGRPVVLIAAALGVPDDVFRNAFSSVSPAPAGERPTREREQRNKRVLLDALGKHGVTNDRLDDVSDYYRYRPGGDELWRHRPAKAVGNVTDGRLTGVTIVDGGAGYTSPPVVMVPGFPDVRLNVTLAFGKDLKSNGRVDAITLIAPATQPTSMPAASP